MFNDRSKRIPKIQNLIFRGVFLANIVMFTVVLAIVGYAVFNNVINTVGNLRMDILEQISINGATINKSATYVGKEIYNNLSYELLTNNETVNEALSNEIQKQFEIDESAFEALDIDLSLMVIMRDGYEFKSKDVSAVEMDSIKSSFWYVDNFSNDKNNFWVTRFGRINNRTNMEISSVRILRDSNREYKGILLVSAKERTVYDIYQDIQSEGNQIYIVDENGYVISHSNKNVVGVQKYYMKAFFEEYGYKGFTIRNISDEKVLFVNYHDRETGWTIIEEYKLSKITEQYRHIILASILGFFVLMIISVFTSSYIARRISKPIERFSLELEEVGEDVLNPLEIQWQYREIHSMTKVYNRMASRNNDLIERIKEEEKDKRKVELDFLQAQINPHLLHNTLFSIKCLLELDKKDRAEDMLGSFMKLLKAPINMDKVFVELSDEIQYLLDYIHLMEQRYDRTIDLSCEVEEELMNLEVPRMLLQPIVENAIFHGFDEKSEGCSIKLSAEIIEDDIFIIIEDNGIGLTSEQLGRILTDESSPKGSFNKIGLKNIRERLKVVYGRESDLVIESAIGEGTKVVLNLSRKDA